LAPSRAFGAKDQERPRGRQDNRQDKRPPRAAPPRERPAARPAPARLPPIAGEALYGLNPVERALAAGRRTLRRLYVRDGKPSERLAKLVKHAEHLSLPVFTGSSEELEGLCSSNAHQGVVLACSPIPIADESAALALPVTNRPVLVVLDQVEDPQNLGAVVRNAAAFGAVGIVVPKHHAAPLSPAASKASAGELEVFPVYEATNLSRFIDACKEKGYWVAGTVVEGGQPLASFKRDTPVVLVLGNEGRGMRPLVERHCDFRLTIPTLPGTSLNVAAASAIALFHLLGSEPSPAAPAPTASPE
jgi:23S rRNA (guanosine2251-2'-O)-methyltransferase